MASTWTANLAEKYINIFIGYHNNLFSIKFMRFTMKRENSDIKVFLCLQDSTCSECGENLGHKRG